MDLYNFFNIYNKVAIAFSGGVDSSYLLCMAKKYGADIKAYYVKTAFQPEFEFKDALKLGEIIGVKINVINIDILSNEEVTANPTNRCYYCKNNIFGTIRKKMAEDGYEILIDGTNASDDLDERPGTKALKELKVLSPLRMCGLTKDKIRELSEEEGLFTYNKAAYACLATRTQPNVKITAEILNKIENAEYYLFNLGFNDFRVRVFYGAARIQLNENDFKKAFEMKKDILEGVGAYFDGVLLDLKGR